MKKQTKKYYWMNEYSSASRVFDSRAEAIRDACRRLKPQEVFAVGIATKPDMVSLLNGSDVLDMLGSVVDRNPEHFGADEAVDWVVRLDSATKAHEDLARRIKPILRAWLHKYGLCPDYYVCAKYQVYEVVSATKAKRCKGRIL